MSTKENYQKITEIANRHLGKVGGAGYKDTYDASLLVAIPRSLNREGYGLTGEEFVGYDVWNAYEVTALTAKGLPVTGMLKIVCPADTEFHVESKSIKLYLNSFNMTRLGEDSEKCIKLIEEIVSKDLSELLKGDIKCRMFTTTPGIEYSFNDFPRIQELINLDNLKFTSYKSDENQLISAGEGTLIVEIDFLRSNCRVTNQPDFGNIFIFMDEGEVPTLESLAKYIVSHRQVSHFHEEIVEMTYSHLMKKFNPKNLVVCALYSRRGGIDINPLRASKEGLIPYWFYNKDQKIRKTLKQ